MSSREIDSTKGTSSSPSRSSDSNSSWRPRFHVDIAVNTPMPITSGNQPPCRNFSEHEATSRTSTAGKTVVAHTATGLGMPQPSLITKKVSVVVISIVTVTAMP